MDTNPNYDSNLIDDIKVKNKVKVKPVDNTYDHKIVEKTSNITIGNNKNNDLDNKDRETENFNFIRDEVRDYTPIVFFINKKSGSKEGKFILDMIPKEVLNLYKFGSTIGNSFYS